MSWTEEQHQGAAFRLWTQTVASQLYVLIKSLYTDYQAISIAIRHPYGELIYDKPHPKWLLDNGAWELAWNDLPAFLMEQLL